MDTQGFIMSDNLNCNMRAVTAEKAMPHKTHSVIYLNGTSSSGKTMLARALLNELQDPYIHVDVEILDQLVSRDQVARGIIPSLHTLRAGFSQCIKALVTAGNNVIVTDILCPPEWLPVGQMLTTRQMLCQQLEALREIDTFYVKVYCPLQETLRRERNRENRNLGLARFQYERVHEGSKYDIEIDTSKQSPQVAAERILRAQQHTASHRAFSLMRTRFGM